MLTEPYAHCLAHKRPNTASPTSVTLKQSHSDINDIQVDHPLSGAYPSLHKGPTGRAFKYHPPIPCYALTPTQKQPLPASVLSALSVLPLSERTLLSEHVIPACDAVAVRAPRGALIRLSVTHGPQVADLNVWNAADVHERLYTSKTRQIHATHLSAGDSLWSSFPSVRPLLTITADTVAYGIDADNAGVHDVIGSRCDPYTHTFMTGGREHVDDTCHSALLEQSGHSVCVRTTYMTSSTSSCVRDLRPATESTLPNRPRRKRATLSSFLRIRTSSLPSRRVGRETSLRRVEMSTPTCYPLGMQVFAVPQNILDGWTPPEKSAYRGNHGMPETE